MDLGIVGLSQATRLGSGGFGTVYRAIQVELGRTVAVKVLPVSGDSTDTVRFAREAAALGALSDHPNIVTVHGSGRSIHGEPYLVMAYVAGGSLADRLRTEGPQSWPTVARVGIGLAGALATAHAAGVLHRDIKPANVLLGPDGDPLLCDFGIARLTDGPQTVSARVTGSVAHLAPELLEGSPPSVGTDLYSLGSTLYTALAGRPPFATDDEEPVGAVFARILAGRIPDLEVATPSALRDLILGLLARNPADRPSSAAQVGADLRDVQRDHAIALTPLVVTTGVGRPAVRAASVDDATGTQATRGPATREHTAGHLRTVTTAPAVLATTAPPDRRQPSRRPAMGALVLALLVVLVVASAAWLQRAVTPDAGTQLRSVGSATTAILTGGAASGPDGAAGPSCDLLADPSASPGGDGTPNRPFLLAQDVLDRLTPGQTGCLAAGTYTESLLVRASGSSEEPITLAALDGARPRIVGGLKATQPVHDVTIRGLVFDGGKTPLLEIHATRITIEANELTNPSGTCLYTGGHGPGSASDVTIRGNLIRGCGTTPGRTAGVSSGWSERLVISDNIFVGLPWIGVDLWPDADNATVSHNTFVDVPWPVDVGGEAVDRTSQNTVISNNLFVDADTYYVKTTFEGDADRTDGNHTALGNCLGGGRNDPQIAAPVTASSNTTATPTFRDRAGGDLRLSADSPCQATGARHD